MVFQGCFKGVFKNDFGVFRESFKDDSRELQGFLREVQRVFQGRPEKSCKLSSIGILRNLLCPKNSDIRDKGSQKICVLNDGVA